MFPMTPTIVTWGALEFFVKRKSHVLLVIELERSLLGLCLMHVTIRKMEVTIGISMLNLLKNSKS
ncbi:hypothetical protein FOPG_20002 [Fusarium oxysporum f. sp. conglutinans race 2 54008]|uniref:Uncharacterized protein n=1 Tax=Fusarium oxysporum f. sp. conglutinans race 2 54008 TaxID=1089457 RepID=X0GUY9_FUSOX|nr:hypothetical protein FOPG_20002 [Fusarium oxysporum f. sp. conglutinans race 2 54008]